MSMSSITTILATKLQIEVEPALDGVLSRF
jgi:hypothetical protein